MFFILPLVENTQESRVTKPTFRSWTNPIITHCIVTCILSWWRGLAFFLSGAESDSRPPWSTLKRRSSLPLTMWMEKGGPFLGVSLSATTSWRMVLPTGSPSCRSQSSKFTFFTSFNYYFISFPVRCSSPSIKCLYALPNHSTFIITKLTALNH